jgi:peptidoglycan hydrolase-like protein with peptidoglycan-binding domain
MNRAIVHLVVALCVVGSAPADETISYQTVQSVQQALKDQGFYYGNVTGDNSAETSAAVRRYQIRNGLQVTGEINPETLRSLNLSSNSVASSQPASKPAATPPKGVGSGDSSRVERSWSPRSFGESDGRVEMNRPLAAPSYRWVPSRINGRIVAEVQHQLASRGYYPGRIDGRYGRRTAFAVGAFQWRSGIPPTGRLDMTTLDALGLSDWNVGYMESLPQSYENWAPVKKFEYGKREEEWKKREEEWKKHHRGDHHGEGKFEYGKWKKKWKEKWKDKWEKDHREDG